MAKHWFLVADQRTMSRYAHLFETVMPDPISVEAGRAQAACGVLPFDRMDPNEVRFVAAKDDDTRCPNCLLA